MREHSTQKTRFTFLLIEVAVLCASSYAAFERVLPGDNDKGFWFYAALLGLILGSRLDTPFFVKPADVVLYAAPAAIALLLKNAWRTWDPREKVAYCLAVAFCIIVGLMAASAILLQGAKRPTLNRLSNVLRVSAEVLGTPQIVYSIVLAFALFAYHSDSAKEVGLIVAAWVLTGVMSPLEGAIRLFRRVRRIWAPDSLLDADGEVAAYQTPGLVLIRRHM
jgi:hypothetical protein